MCVTDPVILQKLLFLYSTAEISATLRPYWSKAAGDHANVVQAIPGMLELVPRGTSKGNGVQRLLDHLGASPKEVHLYLPLSFCKIFKKVIPRDFMTSCWIMAIGDGENDIEMLQLAGLGVALSNGSEKAKAVADVTGVSNDEDGVADAVYRFAF
ncbi:hypothetical protein Cgig2_027925 [Carnegiea gigantea]|uniref:Uncharacterized protein n=1 Tax=Carnegiea gigantea TaxID=171969 RepID=A0A9Q1QL74_9CARY|nr:hypothetical protein Cgig2_027925 [Carnegiea gigantea]